MLTIGRRWDAEELETARRIVSVAELDALDRAERIWAQADNMMRELTARKEALEAPTPIGNPESRDWVRLEEARIIEGARERAKDLLTNALDIIDHNTAAAENARRQQEASRKAAEQARAQADEYFEQAARTVTESERYMEEARAAGTHMLTQAQAECERMVTAARTAAEAEVELAERRIEAKLNALCDAIGMKHGGLDELLGTALSEDEAVYLDLRSTVAVG
jgi:hypothetical protein